MFCPRCGIEQSDDLKFCKSCGANMSAVRQAVDAREGEQKFDWSRTWVAEMFLSHEEQKRRKEMLERERGVTPEIKRVNEIKAGVIISSIGVGLAIFLYVFMQGIILGGKVPHDAAEILMRLWIVGVIPVMVGVALMINGLVVSKRLVEIARQRELSELPPSQDPRSLRAADTSEFIPTNFSVTDQTTRHLESSEAKQRERR